MLRELLPSGKWFAIHFENQKLGPPWRVLIWDIEKGADHRYIHDRFPEELEKRGIRRRFVNPRQLEDQTKALSMVCMSTAVVCSSHCKILVTVACVRLPFQLTRKQFRAELPGFRVRDAKLPSSLLGEVVPVIVSHVESPWEFYIQTDEMAKNAVDLGNELNKRYEVGFSLSLIHHLGGALQAEIQMVYNGMSAMAMYKVKRGVDCVARFVDGILYRGRIRQVYEKTSQIDIEYVDYGNKAKINAYYCLYPLRPEFAAEPRLCIGPCYLEGVERTDKLNEQMLTGLLREALVPMQKRWVATIREESQKDGSEKFALTMAPKSAPGLPTMNSSCLNDWFSELITKYACQYVMLK